MYRLLLLISVSLFLVVPVWAGVPPMISYQGKLMQPSGAPVPDGSYTIQFAIYSQPTGGTALWSETNPAVQVRNGLFATMLGSVVNLPANLFDSPDGFFSVKVGSDPEMTPRQKIASVGYAVKAGSADKAENGIPAGGVIMWSGPANQIPQGWALCDGASGTPDLRDRFVVGAGASYAVSDSGGVPQVTLDLSQLPPHSHGVDDPGHSHSYTDWNLQRIDGRSGFGMGPDFAWDVAAATTGTVLTGISLQSAGGGQPHENRPPYYALCFIMKLAY